MLATSYLFQFGASKYFSISATMNSTQTSEENPTAQDADLAAMVNEAAVATQEISCEKTDTDVVSSQISKDDDRVDDGEENEEKMDGPELVKENEEDIPPDELAFVTPPHFNPQNPFHKHLSELDLSMRCAICYELYHVPVSLLPCLHSFCSYCIRDHFKQSMAGMKRKAQCPMCNAVVSATNVGLQVANFRMNRCLGFDF